MSRSEELDELAVYVHVPFCRERCDYCDFFSVAGAGQAMMARTVAVTLEELVVELNRIQPGRVTSLYFGGGTPSHLGHKLLSQLLQGVVVAAGADRREPGSVSGPTEGGIDPADRHAREDEGATAGPEVTVELNPEDVDEELLAVLADAAVTRVSVGVQSFDARRRRSIGRASWEYPAERALELLDGRFAINVDVISSLPKHGPARSALGREIGAVTADIERALAFGVEHLSVYSLTLDSDRRGLLASLAEEDLFDADDEAEIDEAVMAAVQDRGLGRYEISAYAQTGAECRHNLAYWHLKPYLGVGPGAVSTLPGGPTGVQRITRQEQLPSAVNRPIEKEVENIGPRQFLEDYLLMGLRLTRGLDRARFRRLFGGELWEFAPRTYDRWQEKGLMRTTTTHYRPTNGFHALLNARLREIFAEIGEPSKGVDAGRRPPSRPSY